MTSKQRAYLRGLANNESPILHVGKGGVIDTVVRQADDALTARELIKGRVLETAPQKAAEVAAAVAEATAATVVCVCGRNFVLYRPHPEKPVIKLPR